MKSQRSRRRKCAKHNNGAQQYAKPKTQDS